jgi:hypothetical protein
MPEIITRYPDLVLLELRSAGIKCGAGAKQQILTACPRDRFCAAPAGEICIYGLNDIHKMTQVEPMDFYQTIYHWPPMISWPNFFLVLVIFVAGLLFGKFLSKTI